MDKGDIGYYVAWVGVAIMLAYAILKSVGILHSPTYQEMIPIFSAAVTFGGLIAIVKNTREDVKELKTEVKEIRDKLNHLEMDVEVLKDRQKR